MNPNYYRALVQAKKCSKTDAEKLQEFINNYADETKEQKEIQEIKDDLERLKKFIEYAKTDDAFKYLNALEMLNMGEDTISQIYALLFDVKNEQDSTLKLIKKEFCIEFLKIVRNKENINNNAEAFVLKSFTDKQIEILAENMVCFQHGKAGDVDILLESESGDNKFVCVIENKKNASLSCTWVEEDDNPVFRTQIERYYKTTINSKKYKDYNKKFIFLSHNDHGYNLDLPAKDHMSFSKKGKKWKKKECIEYTKIGDNKLVDQRISDVLNQFKYTSLYHSETVLILHRILEKYKNKIQNNELNYEFIGKTLISNKDCKKMFSAIARYLEFTKEDKMIIAKAIFSDNDVIEFVEDNYSNNATYLHSILLSAPNWENFKRKHPNFYDNKNKLKVRGNSKIRFFNIKKNYENPKDKLKFEFNLLCDFIEYWELHYDFGKARDNVDGYSKIVDGKYIIKVCYELKDIINCSGFPSEIKKIIKEATFGHITKEIEKGMQKKIVSLEDLLWKNNFLERIEEYNVNLEGSDKKYIYWDNHVLIFDNKSNYSNKFYIYYCIDKDEICIKNKENSGCSFLLIENPSINLSNEEIEKINKNLEDFQNTLTR